MGQRLNLFTATRLTSNTRLALTGSGGKSSALFPLGRQYLHHARLQQGSSTGFSPAPSEIKVILAGTTHLHLLQAKLADHHFVVQDRLPGWDEIDRHSGLLLFTSPASDKERWLGLSLAQMDALNAYCQQRGVPLLIEADGSRQRPLKAPGAHEPVVPEWVDMVIVTAGLSGLGQPLEEEWVFRPEIFSALGGIAPGEVIQPEHLARVLSDPLGGLKGIPSAAIRVALLNQAFTPELRAAGLRIAEILLPVYDCVLIANLPSVYHPTDTAQDCDVCAIYERIAGVILAAGASSRYGSVKQLLEWEGEPLVRRAAKTTLAAGLSPVVVVTGSAAVQVEEALQGLPIEVVFNPAWESGQASSVKVGLQALSENIGGAVFLLADQPFVTSTLIRKLVELHASTLAPVIVPLVEDHRSNPVLFDSSVFAEFSQLSGDTGGRALFSHHTPTYLPWLDSRLLFDIDTPQDYSSYNPDD